VWPVFGIICDILLSTINACDSFTTGLSSSLAVGTVLIRRRSVDGMLRHTGLQHLWSWNEGAKHFCFKVHAVFEITVTEPQVENIPWCKKNVLRGWGEANVCLGRKYNKINHISEPSRGKIAAFLSCGSDPWRCGWLAIYKVFEIFLFYRIKNLSLRQSAMTLLA